MRVGMNPNRRSPVKAINPLTFSVITHLPDTTSEYHQNRLEIVQLCLNSMRENAHQDANILIWDNGSCKELRNWLRNVYKPDMLMLSRNIGKVNARTSIIQMLPPSSLVAIADDDVLFLDGWFSEELKLLQTFPNVSCVTGCPLRVMFRWACENTIQWARKRNILQVGKFIPIQWEEDYARSIGREPHDQISQTQNDFDYKVKYKGIEAYLHGHHFQLMGYADKLIKACKFDALAMADERDFDGRLDQLGLRLCTVNRVTRHMGNFLDPQLAEDIKNGV